MHPQRPRDNLPPPLGSLDLGREIEVGEPQPQVSRVARHGSLEDGEGARLRRVGGGGADAQPLAAGGAQGVEGLLPCGVGEEVFYPRPGPEDEVFVVGAFGY